MSVTKFLAAKFNGHQVVSHFGVAPDQTAIIAAMNFMFRVFKEVHPTEAKALEERAQEIAIQTQIEIESRYDIFKELCDDIPRNGKFDVDALAVAVICDEYVLHINEPRQTPDGNIVENYDGIDAGLAKRAQRIWEEACNLLDGLVSPLECSEEAITLGLILPSRNINEHIEKFEKDPDADYSEMLDLIATVKLFASSKTNIGTNLICIMNDIEEELLERSQLSTLPPPPFDEPHAFLEFNADTVFTRLQIAPDERDARSAVQLVYEKFYAVADQTKENFHRAHSAVNAAVESIEPRQRLYRYYAPNFFLNEEILDPRALIYAVVCGNHLHYANIEAGNSLEEPEMDISEEEADPLQTLGAIFETHVENKSSDNIVPLHKKADTVITPKYHGDDLNDVSLQNGIAILEEADCLRAGYWPYPERDPYVESFFIAHVDSIVELRDVEKRIETYSAEELKALEDRLKCYDNLAKHYTDIGQELGHLVAMTGEKIEQRKLQLELSEEPTQSLPGRGFLQLVTPEFRGFE